MNFIERVFSKTNHQPTTINTNWRTSFGITTTHLEYPDCGFYEVLKGTVDKYPELIAMNYFGKKITYAKFYDKIEDVAKGLKVIGVGPGDRVTICMPNTPEAICMVYAVNMVGATASMIHPLSSVNEMEFYLDVAASKYVLCLDLLLERMLSAVKNVAVNKIIVASVSEGMPIVTKTAYETLQYIKNRQKDKKTYDPQLVLPWEELIGYGMTYRKEYQVSLKGADEAIIIYSGGTTGRPKGVRLSNLNFNAEALQACARVESARPGKKALLILPIFHGFGLGVNVHAIFATGATLIPVPKFEPSEFARLIKKYQPSFLIGVPTMFEALASSEETSLYYLKSVTDVICGGDTLKAELRNKANNYLSAHGSDAQLRVGYGLSESVAACILTPSYYYKEGAIGLPFPDMEVRIFKPGSTKECKVNRGGEICISGPTVMMGYLNEPAETATALKTHADGKVWLHTGDLGYKNRDGIVFFENRLKRMIITSGYNVYPQYLETIIASHPAVYTVVVVGIPHPYKKQVPIANIVLKENYEPSDELTKDIKKYCEKSVAKYAMPYAYEYLKAVPKTLIGKVNFRKLEEECAKKYGKKHEKTAK